MPKSSRRSVRDLSLQSLLERLEAILVNAAEGRRSLSDDNQYPSLRRELQRRLSSSPPLLDTHPSVDSFAASANGRSNRSAIVARVRDEFATFDPGSDEDQHLSTKWTGIASSTQPLILVRAVMPLAQAAVDAMIVELSQPGPNENPPMDHREEAIGHLRELHRALGNVLAAADQGSLDDGLGQGAIAEVARYTKRAARALRNDPMPYAAAGLLNGLLSLSGVPGLGGFLGGIAANIRKNTDNRRG